MQTLPSTQQRQSRRRQRGALAVEGMIVIVMMTGVVLGTWYMRKVYSGKLLTMTASRADAWRDALTGCDSGNQQKLYENIHEQSKDKNNKICKDPNNCSDSSVDGLADDGSTSTPPDWFPTGSANATSKSITVSSDTYQTTLTTNRQFSCNEKPAKELQLGSLDLLSSVADIVKKIPNEEVDEDKTTQTCWQKYGIPIRWHQMNCQTDLVFSGNLDPAHLYSQRRDLDIDAPDNSVK